MSKTEKVRIWKFMQQSIQIKGMDLTFDPDVDWSWVKDPEFHKVLEYYRQHHNLLENYIKIRIDDWTKMNHPG